MIARRVVQAPDGRDIVVAIRAPVEFEDDWRAAVEINDETTYAYGVDSLQACALALVMASARLKAYEKALGWTFEGEPRITEDLLL